MSFGFALRVKLPIAATDVERFYVVFTPNNYDEELNLRRVALWPTDSLLSDAGKTNAWCATFADEPLAAGQVYTRKARVCELHMKD